jgi:hypothetical protein
MIRWIALALALLAGTGEVRAQAFFGTQAPPQPSNAVAITGGTINGTTIGNTAPPNINAAVLNVFSKLNASGGGVNNLPGGTLGGTFGALNSGPWNGIGFNYQYTSTATSQGFDVLQERTGYFAPFQVNTNNPTYYLAYDWVFTPSDTSHNWGSGIGEWNISVRLPTTPGWHRDRSTGPQNAGGFLMVPIATSNPTTVLTAPFATSSGSSVVTATWTNHAFQIGQSATFSGGVPVGGLTIAGSFAVTSVVDANTFTFDAGTPATSTTTGGGTVTGRAFNGVDELYGYSVSGSSDFNTATGRPAKSYIGYNCEHDSVPGIAYDPTGHGGNCFYATGARYVTPLNPLATTIGSSTVTLTWTNSSLVAGQTFVIAGATATGGLTISGTYTALTQTSSAVTFNAGSNATSTATGGGSVVTAWATNDVPRAGFETDGAFVDAFRTDQANVTNAARFGVGQNVVWTNGTGTATINASGTGANLTVNVTAVGTGAIVLNGSGGLYTSNSVTIGNGQASSASIIPSSSSVNPVTLQGTHNVKLASTDTAGYLNVAMHAASTGANPALTACGTSPSVLSSATDTKGTITEGTTATGCVITFATAYIQAPDCVVSSPNGAALTSYSVTLSALTLVNASASGNKFTYICMQ